MVLSSMSDVAMLSVMPVWVTLWWRRLEDEQKETQRRRDEIADLTCRLTQKEHECFELTKYVACLKSQLALMAPKLEKYEREVEVYSQQYVTSFIYSVSRKKPF